MIRIFAEYALSNIGVARGCPGGHAPKCLAYTVILRFKMRHPKQNSVIRLKSNILAPQKFLA